MLFAFGEIHEIWGGHFGKFLGTFLDLFGRFFAHVSANTCFRLTKIHAFKRKHTYFQWKCYVFSALCVAFPFFQHLYGKSCSFYVFGPQLSILFRFYKVFVAFE